MLSDGPRVVRETAVVAVAEPMPAQAEVPSGPQRDFQDIHALLGDSDDIIELQNSEGVIHHYIQAPGRQQKKKAPSTVSNIIMIIRRLDYH